MTDPATIDSILSTVLNAGVSSLDEQILLISQCGRKFPVNAVLAKASSEYFRATLESGMTQSGK
jgi:hypothetical protein